MAAGLVTIAHRSGGPLLDIIQSSPVRTGFLAAEPEEYARAILEVVALTTENRRKMIEAARDSVDRFSSVEFEKAFIRVTEPLFVMT
ncbi:GDP-Man:Man(3)GlcNAc(2)-PP-Dol alpha-1,2-mannosyltransferase [Papilio machaon]|uniref:GDP-Man:Man(3)GlcNAc(2)-PP-Dol alpha-1,2-mannosyltransferase n=2 Tax=Papilio machaon TaxID=76193 RepID=A0A0N1INR5_PAPMA|nr:GDP-Man:Man(3)GlcNAc(2)-PP-Dol alpha-1,2-mannosyltransferase [Papilio machaon]